MICYKIGIFLLIRKLTSGQLPESLQTSVRSLNDFSNLVPTTDTTFPDSLKSIQVVAPHNVEQAKVEFAGLSFQVETGSRSLGSFIGEATEKDSWIANKVDVWVHSTHMQDVPSHRAHILRSSAEYNKNGSICQAHHQSLNHALIY